MQIRKNRRSLIPSGPETRQSAEKNMAWAVGSQLYRHRDPLYHITESFQQTFDRIGRSHARDAAGGFDRQEEPRGEEEARSRDGRENSRERNERERNGQNGQTGREARRTGGGERLWTGNVPSALTQFSKTAFQRGAMSASVLNGTGKMMLVSCMKRTLGIGPKHLQQQTLIGTGSQVRNIPGHSPDQMVFNRGFARSALGIVVDTVRDARRVVDSMEAMARGTGELKEQDSGTFRTMYPFLDDSKDLALEAEYRKKLAACTDPREKPVLQNALVQVLSLKAKKAQMKSEFINKLRFVSDRATETLSELEAPGALEEIISSVWGEREPDLPENPEEGSDGRNGPSGGDRPADQPGPGAGPDGAKTEP